MIKAYISFFYIDFIFVNIIWKIGIKNAKVFPDPVAAFKILKLRV